MEWLDRAVARTVLLWSFMRKRLTLKSETVRMLTPDALRRVNGAGMGTFQCSVYQDSCSTWVNTDCRDSFNQCERTLTI